MNQFYEQARALAYSIPICDLGSREGLIAIEIGLREAYRMGRQSVDGGGVAMQENDGIEECGMFSATDPEHTWTALLARAEAAEATVERLRAALAISVRRARLALGEQG